MTTTEKAKTNGRVETPAIETEPQAPALVIPRLSAETLLVPIKGTAPLIIHNFSKKSKQQMLDAQQGRKTPKENRDPEADYQASFYRMAPAEDGTERFGFPVTAFKAATVGAARFYGKSVSMTALRQFLFVHGELSDLDPQPLIHIIGTPRMREDVVRLSGPSRSADLRYRAEFPEWECLLPVTYVSNSLARESVIALIDAGGTGIGVGEWRPEKRGEFGTFQVDTSKEIEVVTP